MQPDRPLTILLAEDNLDNQLVTSLMLESLGFVAEIAGDGDEALRLHAERRHDVILLDLLMPKLDGFEVARTVRARSASATRPWIVALTAEAFDGDAERCLAVGMNDYVTKPIDLGKLNDALDRARVELFAADREVG
jgi:CheY-like chemotaxis protein